MCSKKQLLINEHVCVQESNLLVMVPERIMKLVLDGELHGFLLDICFRPPALSWLVSDKEMTVKRRN